MAIPVNRWEKDQIPINRASVPGDYSEELDSVTVEAGWHDDLRTGESFLVQEVTIALNQYGQLIRRDEKAFEYPLAGAPAEKFKRDTYGRNYLPGVNPGRGERLMETERREYYPWTMFQQGSPNLSRKSVIEGWAIYDMTPDGTGLTAEQKAEAQAKGLNPDGPPKIIIESARKWDEANHRAEIVEDATVPQVAKWKVLETEFEYVFEEPDKYTVYTYRKNHLRPQDMQVSGPTHQRKPSYKYRLSVAVDPPEIKAQLAGENGIKLEVTKGGASILDNPIQPESYRILRKTVSGGSRPPEDDPFEIYDTPPTPTAGARLWTDTAVTDLAGAPMSATPDPTPYDEPGDVDEPDGDEWTVLGEFPNEKPRELEGYAGVYDDDLVNNSEYEYVATAIIGSDESAPSDPDRIQYGGATKSGKITAFVKRAPATGVDAHGDIEIDVLAADPELYGETVEFEIPVDILETEAEAFGIEIGKRHFADALAAKLNVDLEVSTPLAILERGQVVETPAVDWTTTGNQLVISSETEVREWILDGFRIKASRSPGSKDLTVNGTTLYLMEK